MHNSEGAWACGHEHEPRGFKVEGSPSMAPSKALLLHKDEPDTKIPTKNIPLTSMASASKERSQSVTSSSLPRGNACLPCRRRKMRCDGNKPFCGQCASKDRAEDCEYTGDMQGLTRTQMLEENISLLEARIRELENPAESGSSVKLHNPAALAPAPALLPLADSSSQYRPLTSLHQSSGVFSVAEPTIEETHAMINAFLPHASQFGFFLNINRFALVAFNASAANPLSHPSGPYFDPLLSMVCLWGARLSSDIDLSHHIPYLLSRSVQQLSSSLFNINNSQEGHVRAILSVIQAEVLLANYFFLNNRILEGRYHCTAAVSLSVGSHFNVQQTMPQAILSINPAEPMDAIQLGEQINAFWVVYSLDSSWAIASGSASSMIPCPGGTTSTGSVNITTPWPLSMMEYEQCRQAVVTPNDRPIAALLRGVDIDNAAGLSLPALRAKASTLFSHASLLASRYRSDMSMPDSNAFWHEFNTLDNLIIRFTNSLPPISGISSGNPEGRDLLVASTLARVAGIQLHTRFALTHGRSRETCLSFANTIVASVQNLRRTIGHLDPIMAILFFAVCQVYLVEIKSPGSQYGGYGRDYIDRLTAPLERLLHVMTDFGAICPLMSAQADQVREDRTAVH